MTKKAKLLQKIKNNPKVVSFNDLDGLLTGYGSRGVYRALDQAITSIRWGGIRFQSRTGGPM
jgi:hypothetical protein